jgi:SAM-dependent methyltransferase
MSSLRRRAFRLARPVLRPAVRLALPVLRSTVRLAMPILQRIEPSWAWPRYDPARQKAVDRDAFFVSPELSLHDPLIFGCYDLATQRVVAIDDPTGRAFDFDAQKQLASAFRARSAVPLSSDRYAHAVRALEPGTGLCLDACTTGPDEGVIQAVERLGYEYRAIDIFPAPGVQHEDLMALSFAEGSIARIISCDTLEHVPEWPQAMREMYRVLEPEGLLVLHMPVYYFDRPVGEPTREGTDPWEHVRYFAAREVMQCAAACGFVILRTSFMLDYGALLCVLGKPWRGT